jgi:HlyD family secretion protein
LFLIAKDLSRLQVWASVNEADIGRLAPGQRVTFGVDAFPNETFAGQVKQIRLNASMTQNVVTYTVVVDVENEGNKLLPYLTANVKFEVAHRENALLVPNAALNWKPRRELIVESQREAKPPKSAVWVRDGRYVRAIPVKALDSDGSRTEVVPDAGGSLAEGVEVVTGENRAATGANVVNPLLPQMQGKKKD